MNWLFFTIIAFFFNAFSNLMDKFMLGKFVPRPAAYAFFISLVGCVSIAFGLFEKTLPNTTVILASMLAGACYSIALLIFFKVLKNSDASSIAPAVGGLTPIFVFVFAWFILGEHLLLRQTAGLAAIVAGSFFMVKEDSQSPSSYRSELLPVALAAALFGLSHVLSKFTFDNYSFTGGMALRGAGSLFGAALLALPFSHREQIGTFLRQSKADRKAYLGPAKNWAIFLGPASAAIGFIFLNYAFSIGTVTLVSSFSGIQYVFLFIMTLMASKLLPQIVREKLSPKLFEAKLIGILAIAGGVYLIY